MDSLIPECNALLKDRGFDYAFCGGHALDIHIGKTTRPHGDIDLSAYWEDRNKIIRFMQSQDWIVYEAMGGGKVHLLTDTDSQMLIKLNIFCVKEGCSFFHAELIGDGIYKCDIDHVAQEKLDFIEFLFNKRAGGEFIYDRNNEIRRRIDAAILRKDTIQYFAPELVLLYKSTDLKRKVNQQDFDMFAPLLPDESSEWLRSALMTAFPDGHVWIKCLEKRYADT